MKNIKLRIVYLILGAALLLFALFMLAVNVVIPAHFVSEAEKALRNEAQYENRTIPYTYEGEVYDDDWDDGAEEHFFTPSIVFLELENGYQPNTWSQDTYRLEKKLLAYCSERSVAPNRCHDFKADKHHLIFMPGLLIGRFAPAPYNETVNTIGLPIYAKALEKRNGTGWDLEMQSNPLHILTRPRAVIKGTLT